MTYLSEAGAAHDLGMPRERVAYHSRAYGLGPDDHYEDARGSHALYTRPTVEAIRRHFERFDSAKAARQKSKNLRHEDDGG
jgi:hypothetical protein